VGFSSNMLMLLASLLNPLPNSGPEEGMLCAYIVCNAKYDDSGKKRKMWMTNAKIGQKRSKVSTILVGTVQHNIK
jgi:hypothetical protein